MPDDIDVRHALDRAISRAGGKIARSKPAPDAIRDAIRGGATTRPWRERRSAGIAVMREMARR